MPNSTIFLPDVNVWLALASCRHVHAGLCGAWLDTIDFGKVVFCRVSQMGMLRLLTNESVMGSDVLSSRNAWRTYRTILSDQRVSFAPEPFAVELEWTKLTARDLPDTKVWTDAYLSAFASVAGMQLVTLDRAILHLSPDALLLN